MNRLILINLDAINPPLARPNRFCSNSAFVPLVIGAFSTVLAADATPNQEFYRNPLGLICCIVCIFSGLLLIIPRIFKWGWQAKYFGVLTFYFGSVALIGGIPWCCILLYSKLPVSLRIIFFLAYLFVLFMWCRRFFKIYKKILYIDDDKFGIYKEEADVIYYRQKVDSTVLEKKMKFNQFPPAVFTGAIVILAFLTIPFSSQLTNAIGLPFTHIFMAVVAIPTDMIALGFLSRGLIIYYYHPWRLFRRSGKVVYINMIEK